MKDQISSNIYDMVMICPKVMDVDAAVRLDPPELLRAAMVRTARCLMDGQVSSSDGGWGRRCFNGKGVGVVEFVEFVEFVACWSGIYSLVSMAGVCQVMSISDFS